MRFECSLEEYKKYKLGELVENVVAGATPKTSVDDYWNGGDIPWLSSGEVHKKFIYFTDKFITSEGYNNSSTKIVPTNSVLIALAGQGKTRGTVAINKIELCTNQSIASIIPNEMLNYKYLFYYLESKYEYLRALSSSDGGRGGLNLKLIRSIPIQVPSIKEQENISNFINEIDKKILLLEQKHKLYDDFKKYLMQQIFTQKLRFDFNDEWRIRRLNEITFYQEGPGVRNYQYTKEGVKLLNVGNFVNNALELDNTDKYISNEEAYGKYKHFLVDEGDLLIACSGIKAEYFDEKIAFAENKHLPLCMNTSTMRFKFLDENTLNLRYLKYYFQTQSFKKQVFQVMTGSAQFNFGPTHLKYFKIPIPCLDEQIKIYQMFESIDIKILNIYREIMKVKEFKKGLLQQMFVVRINWRCNFKLAKSPSFNKHLLILKNKIIFIIIK